MDRNTLNVFMFKLLCRKELSALLNLRDGLSDEKEDLRMVMENGINKRCQQLILTIESAGL